MSFQKGDIIVRDDTVYPEGALVVDGYQSDGALLAHPMGGGMELAIPAGEIVRFSIVPDAERVAIYRRGKFGLEGIAATFVGWSDGTCWNGWSKPCFELTAGSEVVAALHPPGRYDKTLDAFITRSSEEEDVWYSETIALPDGGTTKVYGIGAGAWIWEEVEE